MGVGPKRGPFRGPQPTRRRLISAAISSFPVFLDWFTPWEGPPAYQIERGLSAAWTQFTTGASVPRTDKLDWFQAYSEPVRSKPDIRWREPFTMDVKWQAPPEIDWGPPLSEPVRLTITPRAPYSQYTSGAGLPTPLVPSFFFQPLSEPVRGLANIRWRDPFTTDWKWTAPAVAFDVYWFSPLSEPVQIEPGLSAAWTQYITGIATPTVTPTAVTYVPQQWTDPIQIEIGLGAPYQQVLAGVGTSITQNKNVYEPLAEPVRSKPDIRYREAFTIDARWTPPTVTDLRNYWFSALSEPVRSKKAVAWQQFLTIDWKWQAPPEADWQQPFSEPVRSKRPVAWQQFFTADWKWTPPFTVDGWYRSLSEPVRSKPDIRYREPFVTDWQWNAPVSIGWFNWLGEPVRSKQAVAWQRPFTIDEQWTPPGVITDLRNFWFSWLSEPVRSKSNIRYREPFTTDWQWTPPTVVITFVSPALSEPVRSRPDIRYREAFTTDWKWLAPSRVDDWYRQLSEPVRSKQDIRWREPFTTDWKWQAPASIVFPSWHAWLAEPVRSKKVVPWQWFFATDWQWRAPVSVPWFQELRGPVWQKAGLHASRQMFFQMDWKWSPPVIQNINYTLSVTETGDNAMLTYTVSSLVYGADVTITEIWVGNLANVTITEVEE